LGCHIEGLQLDQSKSSRAKERKDLCLLLIDPLETSVVVVVGNLLLSEPKSDLSLGSVDRVGTVDEVASNIDGEVATERTRSGVVGVCGTDELTASNNGTLSFPYHCNDSSRGEVLNKTREEGTSLQIIVVLGGELGGGNDDFDSDQLESLGLETGNHFTNQSTLNSIGLEGNESALKLGTGEASERHLFLGRCDGQEAGGLEDFFATINDFRNKGQFWLIHLQDHEYQKCPSAY
jgi:hypothetical protein